VIYSAPTNKEQSYFIGYEDIHFPSNIFSFLGSTAENKSLPIVEHKWRKAEECSQEQIEENKKFMIEKGWWPEKSTWILSSPPPSEDCKYAKVYERGFKMRDGSTLKIGKDIAHWGIVYHYKNDTLRITDVCLNVCDVPDVSFSLYRTYITFYSVIEPWPMDICVWDESTDYLNKYGEMYPLYEENFDCQDMWKAQQEAWKSWDPKTWALFRNCHQLIDSTVQLYQKNQTIIAKKN